MIIRRRHTANFTTIGNALFEDERLQADELGILAWLLSRPNDWEVRRPALMRRHHIGRDALKRIITNWMRTGWCQAQKTRLSNGTFHIIYEIRDQPGRDLTDDEIRDALSLVSSEAVEEESEVESTAETAPDAMPETGDPPTPKPGVDDQRAAGRNRPIEDSLKTESLRTDSTQSVRAFADVREAWPPDHVLSLVACEAQHAGLTDGTKEAAFRGIKPYLDDCRKQNRKICDLQTYYRERRWERFTVKVAASSQFHVRPGTPQAYRWREYLERADKRELRIFDLMMDRNGYTAPSEWPPPLPPKAADNSTGHPLSNTDIESMEEFK